MKILLLLILHFSYVTADTFRFAVHTDISGLDPITRTANDTHHLFNQLYRGLYSFQDDIGLKPEIAEKCVWKSQLKLVCTLSKKAKWSDGTDIKSEDFVNSFKRFIDPNNKAKEAGVFSKIKNYDEIYQKKFSLDTIGISSVDNKIEFEFDEYDPEFLLKISSPLFVPFRQITSIDNPATYLFNGPYTITEWKKNKVLKLSPNPFWRKKINSKIEIYFVDEAITQLNLYESNKLDMVLELPVTEIKSWENKKDFLRTPMARFDYIGFSKTLPKELRQALSLGVDYEEFKQVFQSLGRAGCPGLPDFFYDKSPCYTYDQSKALARLEYIKSKGPLPSLKLYYTKIASNNLKQVAEWYQAQFKKNLKLDIELSPLEFAMYRQKLRTNPPDFFRVGLTLDRPTCSSALESFTTNNADNFVKYSNPKFDKLVQQLVISSNPRQNKVLCRKGTEMLLNDFILIPQGQIHFARLIKPNIKGVLFNSLGQLDLSELSVENINRQ